MNPVVELAGIRRLEKTQDAEQRGLSRAIRADHGQHLAGHHGEMRHVEDGAAVVGHSDAGQLDDGGHADGRTWMEPRCMESSQRRSRPISRIS